MVYSKISNDFTKLRTCRVSSITPAEEMYDGKQGESPYIVSQVIKAWPSW